MSRSSSVSMNARSAPAADAVPGARISRVASPGSRCRAGRLLLLFKQSSERPGPWGARAAQLSGLWSLNSWPPTPWRPRPYRNLVLTLAIGGVPVRLVAVRRVAVRLVAVRLVAVRLVAVRLIAVRLITVRLVTVRLVTVRLVAVRLVTGRLVTVRLVTVRLVTVRLVAVRLVTVRHIARGTAVLGALIGRRERRIRIHGVRAVGLGALGLDDGSRAVITGRHRVVAHVGDHADSHGDTACDPQCLARHRTSPKVIELLNKLSFC